MPAVLATAIPRSSSRDKLSSSEVHLRGRLRQPAPLFSGMTTNPTPHTHAWGTQPEMFGPRHEHRLGMILREVRALPRGARVLDGAVGLGQLATRMHADGYRVTGIDYS